MSRYKQMPMPPSQIMLFGQSVEEALPKDSDVQAFRDVMDCLDYRAIESRCSATGAPPYPPEVMVKILGYAYSKGIRSSRNIECSLNVDVRFIWLAGGLRPDHNTLARFRKDNGEELKVLFKDSVRVCCESGLVFLNTVSVDGTKILAAASKRRVYSQSRIDREMAAIEKILQEAEEMDRVEDAKEAAGERNEIPDGLKDAKERKARLEEIARRLRESKRKTVVASEPDSRVMVTDDVLRPAYNLQAAVDGGSRVIVAMKLTDAENDHGQLPAMVSEVESNTGLSPDASLADTGYSDEYTFKWIEESGREVLMPSKEHPDVSKRIGRFANEYFVPDGKRDVLICPEGKELHFQGEYRKGSGTYRRYAAKGCRGCPFYRECVPSGRASRRIEVSIVATIREEMRQKLRSPEGKELYNLRRETVEPVFGQMKSNMGFGRFLLKGYEGASAEAALMCMVHNVMKCAAKADLGAHFAHIKTFCAVAPLLLMPLSINVRRPARLHNRTSRLPNQYCRAF
jgi:transposase